MLIRFVRHSIAAFADKQQPNGSNKITGRSSADDTKTPNNQTRNKSDHYDQDDIDTGKIRLLRFHFE